MNEVHKATVKKLIDGNARLGISTVLLESKVHDTGNAYVQLLRSDRLLCSYLVSGTESLKLLGKTTEKV